MLDSLLFFSRRLLVVPTSGAGLVVYFDLVHGPVGQFNGNSGVIFVAHCILWQHNQQSYSRYIIYIINNLR